MRDLTIPLMDGETAFLRVPISLTEENYEYLLEQLTVFKKGIVARAKTAELPQEIVQPTQSPTHQHITQGAVKYGEDS
jgi:hypothetical protein